MTGGIFYIVRYILWYEMNKGGGVYPSTGIGCAKPSVLASLGLLDDILGGGV